jgi:DNA mismatch repair protein MutL
MPIKVLDRETVNRIAAGEVVERPASVVKELVENALDAGARQISVEIRGGGIALVRVTDDGSGIPADEVALAFERHATSKISGPGDLHNIRSLGFRGEALPSIAAVARVEVVTCAAGETAGTFLSLEGGAVTAKKSQARSRGTTLTVRDLFRRVPARLKFLKSVPTETSHVANVVTQYALAYPEVAFELIVDNKSELHTSGRGRLTEAVLDVYGTGVAARMLEVGGEGEWSGGENNAIKVDGLVGAPDLSRTGRGYLSFFVNRRWVSSRLLTAAVEEAYRGLMMTGRHPVVVLNMEIPPEDVDVNIHPAKSEVKFSREPEVFRAVQRAVRRALVAQAPVPRIEDINAPYSGRPAPGDIPLELPLPVEGGDNTPSPSLRAALPMLRVVGQVLASYIVAEGPDGLYVIDQHAAHERVRYEKVLKERDRGRPEVQGLLEPATLELAPRQDAVMKGILPRLAEYGFALEPFGERTYLVRSVPAVVAGDDWPAMLRELLDTLSGEAKGRWEEAILASVACHGAVRAGQVLSAEEMRALVRQLEQCASPHTCPHGRPTIIRLTAAQLEKQFGRS